MSWRRIEQGRVQMVGLPTVPFPFHPPYLHSTDLFSQTILGLDARQLTANKTDIATDSGVAHTSLSRAAGHQAATRACASQGKQEGRGPDADDDRGAAWKVSHARVRHGRLPFAGQFSRG